MTSRPDSLDPDVKSRAPPQFHIFDPEGEARRDCIRDMFQRRALPLSDTELAHVLPRTAHDSARDVDHLGREVAAQGKPVRALSQILVWWRYAVSSPLSGCPLRGQGIEWFGRTAARLPAPFELPLAEHMYEFNAG